MSFASTLQQRIATAKAAADAIVDALPAPAQQALEAAEEAADAAVAAFCKRKLSGGHGPPFKAKVVRTTPRKAAPARHQRNEAEENEASAGAAEVKDDGEPDIHNLIDMARLGVLPFPLPAATLRRMARAVRAKKEEDERRTWVDGAVRRVLDHVQAFVCRGEEGDVVRVMPWLDRVPPNVDDMEALLQERIEAHIPGVHVTFDLLSCATVDLRGATVDLSGGAEKDK